MFKQISNMTKFYCPNKSIYCFVKINTKISEKMPQGRIQGVPPGTRRPLPLPLGAIFLSRPLTWNPGSASDINLNMYIINVIADDESKISLYEI